MTEQMADRPSPGSPASPPSPWLFGPSVSSPAFQVRLRDRALTVTMAGDTALSLERLSLESLEGDCDETILPGTEQDASWGSEAEPLGVA